MLACKLNNHEGVETLLSKGASINQKDFVRILYVNTIQFTKDAIYYCVKYNSQQALATLIKASLFLLDSSVTYANLYGNILHIAAQYSTLPILQKLLDTDIYDVNLIDKYERSPIFYSVLRLEYPAVKILAAKCCFLDFEDVYGRVLLDYASELHHDKILTLLVKSGATLGKSMSKGIDLMYKAVDQHWIKLFKALIKKGVAVGAVHPERPAENVLMLAYESQCTEILEFIMGSSENILFGACDMRGQSILSKAVLK